MLLSIVFSNDSSLLLKFIQRGVCRDLQRPREDAGRCIICLLGSWTQLSLLKLLFCYLLKGQWGHKPMFKDKRLLSMHLMVQGHVQIPGLYGDAGPGPCIAGEAAWTSLITYLSTMEVPAVSAQQMARIAADWQLLPGPFHADSPGPLSLQKSVLLRAPQL